MWPSNKFQGRYCPTQKVSTCRSQICLQEMQLPSNFNKQSCLTQMGFLWRSQISLHTMWLAWYKWTVHESVKYPCRHCNYQETSNGNKVEHQRAVHEEAKYCCSQCNFHATKRSYLAKHKRAVHEGVKYNPAGNATNKQLQKEVSRSTRGWHMKKPHILADNATIKSF